MKAHEQAKAYGLKQLSQVTRCTGVQPQKLRRWHRDQPRLFKAVCLGVKVIIDSEIKPKELAPWRDFNGNDLYDGDWIVDPDGDRGIIYKSGANGHPSNEWLVRYECGIKALLQQRVGDKGRAVKVD